MGPGGLMRERAAFAGLANLCTMDAMSLADLRLLAGLALVEGFNIPQRVGAWIQIEVAYVRAGGCHLEPVIERDGRKIGGEDLLCLVERIRVSRLFGQRQVRAVTGRIVLRALITRH